MKKYFVLSLVFLKKNVFLHFQNKTINVQPSTLIAIEEQLSVINSKMQVTMTDNRSELTDNELIRRYKDGDYSCFEYLMDRYRTKVYGYIFSAHLVGRYVVLLTKLPDAVGDNFLSVHIGIPHFLIFTGIVAQRLNIFK